MDVGYQVVLLVAGQVAANPLRLADGPGSPLLHDSMIETAPAKTPPSVGCEQGARAVERQNPVGAQRHTGRFGAQAQPDRFRQRFGREVKNHGTRHRYVAHRPPVSVSQSAIRSTAFGTLLSDMSTSNAS